MKYERPTDLHTSDKQSTRTLYVCYPLPVWTSCGLSATSSPCYHRYLACIRRGLFPRLHPITLLYICIPAECVSAILNFDYAIFCHAQIALIRCCVHANEICQRAATHFLAIYRHRHPTAAASLKPFRFFCTNRFVYGASRSQFRDARFPLLCHTWPCIHIITRFVFCL